MISSLHEDLVMKMFLQKALYVKHQLKLIDKCDLLLKQFRLFLDVYFLASFELLMLVCSFCPLQGHPDRRFKALFLTFSCLKSSKKSHLHTDLKEACKKLYILFILKMHSI